jgi:lysophospholipase L1-like esterase
VSAPTWTIGYTGRVLGVILTLVALVLVLATTVAWRWYRVLQPPALAPERWSESLRPKTGPVVLCLGDSITHGHLGSDWTGLLVARGVCVVNGGINGELAWNLVQRVDRALACRPDVVTILIGANDAMAAHDEPSARHYVKLAKLPRPPDLEWFEENLRELVRHLQEKSEARIALMTLAPIGEDPRAPIAALIGKCNTVIARVAGDLDVELLPLHDRLMALLAQRSEVTRPLYVSGIKSTIRMLGAGVLHYLLGMSWDRIATRRRLALTVDLVHLNDRAGAVVADLVEEFASKGNEAQK